MVDFSYKRPVLLEMAEKANSIPILDHHKTAAEDLVDLPANVTAKFDMGAQRRNADVGALSRSGTATAPAAHRGPRPVALRAPEHAPDSGERLSFPTTSRCGTRSWRRRQQHWRREGEAIERKHFKDIRELLGVTTREMVIGAPRSGGEPALHDEQRRRGTNWRKGRPFAARYRDTPEGRSSACGRATTADVAEVAKQYGGGGHRNAAGFRVSFAQAQAFEV